MKLAVFGGSGKTGKEILIQSLIKGYEIRVLTRQASSIDLKDERLEIITGDAKDPAMADLMVQGTDAVLVALGARNPEDMDVHSVATANIVAAMKKHGVKKLLVVSSAGVTNDGKSSSLIGKMLKPTLHKIFADKTLQKEIIENSGLDWVLVRPVTLIDGQKTGKYHITEDKPEGKTIARADVAAFLLAQLNSDKYHGRMPFISY